VIAEHCAGLTRFESSSVLVVHLKQQKGNKMSTIKNTILSVTRRTVKGFTVGEIYDRLATRALSAGTRPPPYNSVRARVYELEKAGSLCVWDTSRIGAVIYDPDYTA